jgi:type II secretory pathway pseudopilin PulG
MHKPSRQTPAAFTLLELLVAIAVTVLIVVMLSGVFTAAGKQWQSADQKIDSFRDARAALQIIDRDLGRAHVTGDAQMLTLSNLDGSGSFAKEAFAVTPIPNSGKSDLCVVGFYCVWDAASKTYSLKRLFRDSDTVVTSLAKKPADFGALFTKTAANEEELASCAWDLRFVPGTEYATEAPTANPSTKWRWIEVRFKSMSAAAARRIRNMTFSAATWEDPNDPAYKNAVLPYQQQFVVRVNLHQRP